MVPHTQPHKGATLLLFLPLKPPLPLLVFGIKGEGAICTNSINGGHFKLIMFCLGLLLPCVVTPTTV